MLKLSFEKAQADAQKMEKLMGENTARDYKEADILVELDDKKAELADAQDTIEWLNNKHEELIDEFKKMLIESTTGLKRREMLYKDMEEKISNLFGIENINDVSDEEVIALVKSKNPIDFKNEPLYVMLGDMSYLSLANEGGHSQGDELLGETGKAIKNEFTDASRHGGDEFTTLILLQKKVAEEKVAKLEEDIQKMKNISELGRFGLKPNMDIGIAHFSESLKAFQEIILIMEKTDAGKEKLAKLDALKEMQNIWLEIADKRSTLKKAMTRIPLLLGKKEKNPEEYKELYKFLNKGAYGIEAEDLEEIGTKIKNGANPEEVIFEYIKKMELLNLKKKSGYEKAKEEVIIRTADDRIL
ncbi:MAG: hypothetical protein US83_C0008G0058 [Candidatus Falkowbacteria bacterium GW2011_GWC2_38_22]|nr:MAG: hypothetical protein US83_C0008G0058 [Candidatus Falkowbacteria bacterium GW2011_GWC2_38_22]HAM88134.1 hypothetical protein [Candidatus Falkowbacteria bacterium]HAY11738.1 hypothetical protein [Candidatus Falkowbacteria bacterium]HBI97678.1 hypothetical protein [Candidatus Falkowbacteria bacterium]HBT27403.1 hypothetical protein [Candidatus Falkowbacteria bacterium]